MRPHALKPRHTVHDIAREMKTIKIIQHRHVERRSRRAFFFISTDVEVVVIVPSVGEPMNQPGIAVVSEDYRFVGGEH